MLLAKTQIKLKQALVKVSLALFVLVILTMAISMAPAAKAQAASGASILLNPSQGSIGTTVKITGTGFASDQPVSICFVSSSYNLLLAYANSTDAKGNLVAQGTVPTGLTSGTYSILATDGSGNSATATFTVIGAGGGVGPSTTTVYPTVPPTSTSPYVPPYSTYQPVYTPTVQSAGFWSPLAIAIVVVVALAVVISMTFMFRSRVAGGKRETLLEKEPTPYRPEPYVPPNRPTSAYNPSPSGYNQPPSRYSQYIASRYGQPASSRYTQRPTYGQNLTTPSGASRYIPPSSNVQPSAAGRTCPHCGRVVRGDYNICPYCYKRIK